MRCVLFSRATENPRYKEDAGDKIWRRATELPSCVASLLWTHKNLILFPVDVYFDGVQAYSHFINGNTWWGVLTVVFILLPNLTCALNVMWKQDDNWPSKALRYFLFLHFETLYR